MITGHFKFLLESNDFFNRRLSSSASYVLLITDITERVFHKSSLTAVVVIAFRTVDQIVFGERNHLLRVWGSAVPREHRSISDDNKHKS